MWINRSKYEKLIKENERLKSQLNERYVKDGGLIGIPIDDFNKMVSDHNNSKDTIKTLTAERDFYKNKFAEMKHNFYENGYDKFGAVSFWIKERGKPHRCAACGYSVWNDTDSIIRHCDECGRYMTHTQINNIKENDRSGTN